MIVRFALLLLTVSAAHAQSTSSIAVDVSDFALVVLADDDDDGRSCLWPLEGTSGLCYLEALSDDPAATCLWTVGMVGVVAAFLYASDTVCGTPNGREQADRDPASGADVIVRASSVAGIGVGAREGDALMRVEALDTRTGSRLPLDGLGSRQVTIRERDLPALLVGLRTP